MINNFSKDIDESDLACILFTSGTTADPKGVMLSHGNLVRTALATIKAMNWQENDRMCISLPLFHCFGLTSSLLSGIILGSSMCILSNARSVNVLANIQKYECTILNGVPSMFLAIIKNAHFPEFDTKSLKSGIIAGSPLSKKEYMEICKKIPSITLLPSYGQTETSPAVSFALADDSLEKRVDSVGKILPEVEVQILDLQSKKPVELMESGEIVVRGYNVMQGYYKMPEATENTLTSDGWLYTGDIGYIDNEGYLYLVGRKKDIIIRSGENISPTEITQALLEIDTIENAAVFGIPAEVVQEEIVACLILKEGAVFDENAIKEYLKERIAYYKIPSKFFVMESFPMTANGKVKTSAIKDLILEQI